MSLLSGIFGSTDTKRYNTMTDDQVNNLNTASSALLNLGYQNAYQGNDQAQSTLNTMLQSNNAAKNTALRNSAHSNKLHSSGQAARNANISNQYDAQSNQQQYNYWNNQQQLEQQANENMYNRNLQKYGTIASLNSQPRFENVMSRNPGALGYLATGLGTAAAVKSLAT